MYSDNEFTHRAYRDGVVIEARDLVFEHRHPYAGKGAWDATYERQNRSVNYDIGFRLFCERNPGVAI